MAKRKTIKHNPLDSLSTDSPHEPPAGFENLLTTSGHSSPEVAVKPKSQGKPNIEKDFKSKAQAVRMKPSVEKDQEPRNETKEKSPASPLLETRKSGVEVSPNNLAQRVSRLEEDNRLQNIMIGIILLPLAVLALLGASPTP